MSGRVGCQTNLCGVRNLRDVPAKRPLRKSQRRWAEGNPHVRPHLWINGRLVVFSAVPPRTDARGNPLR